MEGQLELEGSRHVAADKHHHAIVEKRLQSCSGHLGETQWKLVVSLVLPWEGLQKIDAIEGLKIVAPIYASDLRKSAPS